jgi:predicted dehydrogenase
MSAPIEISPEPIKLPPVVKPGEFVFSATHLNHGHVYSQVEGLIEAGGTLRSVYDVDPARAEAFQKKFPQAKIVDSLDRILDDKDVRLVAAAAISCDRGPLGVKVMRAGKDYFTDKTPFTSLDQLADARKAAAQTGRKYMVFYCERLHSECSIFAGYLIRDGVIGRVVHVLGLGPHRMNAPARPAWFFERAKAGGILGDIGSHQIEQFLFFAGAKDATITHAVAGNLAHKDYPEFEDFGEASLIGDNGALNYFRVDWFTPDGLSNWGDGRVFIIGTKGTIELRKNVDVARGTGGDQVYLVTSDREQHLSVNQRVGCPFFGELILDCLNRTEKAMTQAHAFKAAELCLLAQQQARPIA